MNIHMDEFVYRSDMEKQLLHLFHKKLELHVNQFVLTKLVKFNQRENHHKYKNRYYAANKFEILEDNFDVQRSRPWFSVKQKPLFIFLGRVLSEYNFFRMKFALQKPSQSLGRSKY